LVTKAREMVHSYRIALVFMLMCNVSVTLVQLICNLLFLPPILSGFQVLSLILFPIPLLSYSLIHKKESNDLRCSTKKNLNLINKQDVQGFIVKFLIKFVPSVLILVMFHFLSLYFKCKAENTVYPIQPDPFSLPSGGNTTAFENNPRNGTSLHRQKKIVNNKYECHLFAFDL
jgi:hypothetical protein